jgi:hypothetical protein
MQVQVRPSNLRGVYQNDVPSCRGLRDGPVSPLPQATQWMFSASVVLPDMSLWKVAPCPERALAGFTCQSRRTRLRQ